MFREELVLIKVRFHKSLTRYLLERRWHPSQKDKKLKDGSLELAFEVAGTKEIKTWILGFGSLAKVLEPALLVKEIKNRPGEVAEILRETIEPTVRKNSKRITRFDQDTICDIQKVLVKGLIDEHIHQSGRLRQRKEVVMANPTEKDVKSWVDASRYDLATARALLKSRRYLYVLFMCQQAIEKILKAVQR